MIDTVKADRKRCRRHFRREVNGDDDSIIVMIVFVPCRLVPIGFNPLAYRGHRSRKLTAPNCHTTLGREPAELKDLVNIRLKKPKIWLIQR